MTATWAQTYTYALQWLGTPYELGGEGSVPGQPLDCSRFVQVVLGHAGISVSRTTETQWADYTLPHEPKTAAPQPGWVVYFLVPSDGGGAPQHVGICIGNGMMIEAPHTGADVQITGIPNTAGESIYGYIVPPYASAPTPPPAPPQLIFKPLTGRYGVLNKPVVAIVRRPQNDGYWEVAADGGTFNYGNAAFLGSLGSIKLNAPIVDAACTPSGKGLVLVATDGGIFNFGDSQFYGSMGGKTLNAPIVSIELTESGNGYWCAAADGGIFCFGDAAFLGSAA